jgi:hypothetical protein
MNTRISYRYADKRNCKQFTTIVIQGTITWEQIAPYLVMEEFFIPGQIGLEDLQHRFVLPGADHPWHQIVSDDIKPTAASPTIALSGEDVAWRLAHAIWDPSQNSAPVLLNQTTRESKTPTGTPTEAPHSSQHRYARGKQPPAIGAVGTPARKRSARIK